MFIFQWNALRVGDRVMVHDDLDAGLTLHGGIVQQVDTRPHGANGVGIRLDGADSRVLRPRRHAVHLLPDDRRFSCWRCDTTTTPTVDVADVKAAA
jgi:hypothetical protein